MSRLHPCWLLAFLCAPPAALAQRPADVWESCRPGAICCSWEQPCPEEFDCVEAECQERTAPASLVRKVIEKGKSKTDGCLTAFAAREPQHGGQVTVVWTIGVKGNVTSAQVEWATLKDSELHQCLIGLVQGWKFATPGNRPVVARQSFELKGPKPQPTSCDLTKMPGTAMQLSLSDPALPLDPRGERIMSWICSLGCHAFCGSKPAPGLTDEQRAALKKCQGGDADACTGFVDPKSPVVTCFRLGGARCVNLTAEEKYRRLAERVACITGVAASCATWRTAVERELADFRQKCDVMKPGYCQTAMRYLLGLQRIDEAVGIWLDVCTHGVDCALRQELADETYLGVRPRIIVSLEALRQKHCKERPLERSCTSVVEALEMMRKLPKSD